jgi:hypothetical protein
MYLGVYHGGYAGSLWTPFGEVKLLGSGWSIDLRRISASFLREMQNTWVIEDVTSRIDRIPLPCTDQCAQRAEAPHGFVYIHPNINVPLSTVYLIRTVGSIDFLPHAVHFEDCLYGDQRKRDSADQAMFETLSKGKNGFF